MTGYSIRKINDKELIDVYKHIKKDFAPDEYAPYEVLYHQVQNGEQEGMILCKDEQDVAYAICAGSSPNGFVLISLLAVYEQFRCQGIGSVFLNKLGSKYSNKSGIIVEVEKPEESSSKEERDCRKKRIEFYKKAGFCLIPNIDYSIWDVPMHLMAMPLSVPIESINETIGNIMYEIYLQLMGKRYIHKLKFSRQQLRLEKWKYYF
ncbi:GNAT family N-acetyltransferase [Pseudobacteroides cellulosolvens]|uniref:GCN5-related N-acetyltransferase n=1 Tax=Pseudobacteroides cellulosolvens ATCC 35603 = DSM 2933 TaxID=398512 RepID=A0A0L6JT95_9FIRM|nr:GNAT family N-acetyltransferase [Pseudobacteroides cellulosolvens]KNY28924.1 GCN5-related N-acetyltransferase [Pseudobacteroides cellulosolvens ATCC 35603 = DSM 2933]